MKTNFVHTMTHEKIDSGHGPLQGLNNFANTHKNAP